MPKQDRGVALGAAVVMAYHVTARATRDTVFLTVVGIPGLPLMTASAAIVGMAAALYSSSRMPRQGARWISIAFGISALLTLVDWALIAWRPTLGAIVFYLHVAGLSPVLVSGFWATLTDSLDPRTARRSIGRISAIATAGGLASFAISYALAAWRGVPAVLLLLAAANLACAAMTLRVVPVPRAESRERTRLLDGWDTIRREPHLANLALLVLGAAISAGILDYLFKSQVRSVTQGLQLYRVLLAFNAAVMIGTFLVQLAFRRIARRRDWIASTIGSLPATVVAGSLAAWALPTGWLLAAVRGGEAVLHGSLFRGGYELLYSGLPRQRKLAVRTLIDVGCDRFGDLLAQGIILFAIASLSVLAAPTLLLVSGGIAAACLLVVVRLRRGHGEALEESLRNHASFTALQFSTGASDIHLPEFEREPGSTPKLEPPVERPAARPKEILPTLRAHEVRDAILRLGAEGTDGPSADALSLVAERHVGQLVDVLLDPDMSPEVCRAVVTILERCADERAIEGVVRGLLDARSEVRYRCGAALCRLHERGIVRIGEDRVFAAVRWELQHTRIHTFDPARHRAPGSVDGFLAHRAAASVEHLFHVLALVFPREPLLHSLAGLRSSDASARGTALEYLDEVLPAHLAEEMKPVLAAARPARPSA